MRIWALGDIHSNASALEAALRVVDAHPGDQLVFLGDLLTYGAEPQRVLDIVAERAERGAILVLGNHDELYQSLVRGDPGGLERMSPWLAASVEWTAEQIDPAALRELPFQVEHITERALFAHANPWFDRPESGVRWAYLSSHLDHRRAADVLRARSLSVGVFGHTHRSRIVQLPSGEGLEGEVRALEWAPTTPRDVLVLNAGSVGQPRNLRAESTLLELEGDREGWKITVHRVHYPVDAHLARLWALPLPEPVRARLAKFFTPRAAPRPVSAGAPPPPESSPRRPW